MKKPLAVLPLLLLAALALAACASAPRYAQTPATTGATTTPPVHATLPPATVLCPACKVIIDYGALQSASADSEKSAYAQWETVLAGLESGAWTWSEVGPLAHDVCEWADEIRERTVKLEKALRDLAERKPVKR